MQRHLPNVRLGAYFAEHGYFFAKKFLVLAPAALASFRKICALGSLFILVPIFSFAALPSSSVVLAVEADSTAPPFYRGRSLSSYHGSARVVAVPFFVDAKGVRINPKSLVYTWRILDRVPEGSSGVGRDTFVWTARAPFRATEIEVEAATPDGEAVARATIVARAAPAQALLYEAHPLYGMLWNRALSSAKLMGEEMRLAVGSFFFNRRDEALLQYKWTQNSVPLVAAIGKSTAFRREGRSGRADIGVEVTNPSAMFQVGKARTVLEF